MSKPREFWISEIKTEIAEQVMTLQPDFIHEKYYVHVIEKSALDQANQMLKHLEDENIKLRRCQIDWGNTKLDLESRITELESIFAYLPKVPTQPYEKELAQKIQALEAENQKLHNLKSAADSALERISKLASQNQKLKEALEFYGNEQNWDKFERGLLVTADSEQIGASHIAGKKAREALADCSDGGAT